MTDPSSPTRNHFLTNFEGKATFIVTFFIFDSLEIFVSDYIAFIRHDFCTPYLRINSRLIASGFQPKFVSLNASLSNSFLYLSEIGRMVFTAISIRRAASKKLAGKYFLKPSSTSLRAVRGARLSNSKQRFPYCATYFLARESFMFTGREGGRSLLICCQVIASLLKLIPEPEFISPSAALCKSSPDGSQSPTKRTSSVP